MAKAASPLVTVGSCTTWTPAGGGHGDGQAAIGEDHVQAVPGEGTGDGQRPAQMAAAEQALDPEEAGHAGRNGMLASKAGRPASSRLEQERALGVVADGRLAPHVPAEAEDEGGAQDALVGDDEARSILPGQVAKEAGEAKGHLARALAVGRRGSRGRRLSASAKPGTELDAEIGEPPALEGAPAHLLQAWVGGGLGEAQEVGRLRARPSGLVMQGAAAKPVGKPPGRNLLPALGTQRDVGLALGAAILVPGGAGVADQAETHACSRWLLRACPRAAASRSLAAGQAWRASTRALAASPQRRRSSG